MTWLTAHWTGILTVWGLIWAVATALQNVNVTWVKTACHVILALSPLDVVKALKQLGVALVPPVACLALFLLACGASTPSPTTSAVEEAAIFGSQLNVCVQTASSRDVADQCRAGVEKFWCGPGGALASYSGCQGYKAATVTDGGSNDAR